MNDHERAVMARLVAALDDRMTAAGHPAQLVAWEHRGVCGPTWCSQRCQAYRALFVAATALLEVHAVETPVQVGMFEEVAAGSGEAG